MLTEEKLTLERANHYIQENKAFVCNTYYSVNRNYLEHFLYDRAYELIKPVLKEKELELTQKTNKLFADYLGSQLDILA